MLVVLLLPLLNHNTTHHQLRPSWRSPHFLQLLRALQLLLQPQPLLPCCACHALLLLPLLPLLLLAAS